MALEAAYLMDSYPSDDQYKKLGSSLNLTSVQVREWFCKRRKKSKDGENTVVTPPGTQAGTPEAAAARPARRRRKPSSLAFSNKTELAIKVITRAKDLLLERVDGFEYREDGPELGLYFDNIPSRAGSRRTKRVSQRQELSRLLNRVREEEKARKREEIELRKREQEAIRKQKQAEREAERAMKMQLKLELLEKKEMERQHKLQERLERERELQEQKRLREEEKAKARVARQREREEAMKKKEEEKQERKRLREFERMKAAEERAALKLLQEQRKQIVEDEALEREEYIAALKQKQAKEAEAQGIEAPMELDINVENIPLSVFPPEGVKTINLFDAKGLAPSGMDKQLTSQVEQDLLMLWKFIRDYSFVVNVKPLSLGELAGIIALGMESKQLADLHMSMLKLLLADIEESHSLVNQEDGLEHKGGQISGLDRVVHTFSQLLGEIWEWHYGSDVLRAQRNYLTWPEVMRQFLVIFGYGAERPKPKRKDAEAEREAIVPMDEHGNPTGPKLVVPATCKPGTIKGSTWTILTEAGAKGLTPAEICEKIIEKGLRGSVSTTKSPEASVSQLLSRDSFVFEKMPGNKYALRSIKAWHRKQAKKDKEEDIKKEEEKENSTPVKKEEEDGPVKMEQDEAVKNEDSPNAKTEGENKDDDEEKEEEDKPLRLAEPWVTKLAVSEYNDLTIADRCSCLAALCNAVMECPSFYQQIEASQREKDTLVKRLREVNRDEKKLANLTSSPAAAGGANAGTSPDKQDSQQAPDDQELQIAKAELESLRVEKKDILGKLDVLTDEINRRPLGMDRRFNRYYLLRLSPNAKDSLLMIEYHSDHTISVIRDKASLDALVGALNIRGLREGKLLAAIEQRKEDLLAAFQQPKEPCQVVMPSASLKHMVSFPTEALSLLLRENRRIDQNLTVDTSKSKSKILIEKLKADMVSVYKALPSDSFEQDEWDGGEVWMIKVQSAEKVVDLRDILGELEGAIKEKVVNSDHFNPGPTIVPGAWHPSGYGGDDDEDDEEGCAEEAEVFEASVGDLSWLPATTAALQYRLRCLDAACRYRRSVRSLCERSDAYRYIQRDNAINSDGTNFTTLSSDGSIKVSQNFSRKRDRRRAFPPFPATCLGDLSSDFQLSYQLCEKQLKKVGHQPPAANEASSDSEDFNLKKTEQEESESDWDDDED